MTPRTRQLDRLVPHGRHSRTRWPFEICEIIDGKLQNAEVADAAGMSRQASVGLLGLMRQLVERCEDFFAQAHLGDPVRVVA